MKAIMKSLFGLTVLTFAILSQQSFGQNMFQTYDMVVSDPAGVIAAMNKLQSSSTGSASSANVFLYQYLANGESQATHSILVVHSSIEEMNSNLARNAGSSDWTTFVSEVSQAAQIESEAIGQFLGVGGDPSAVLSPNRAGMVYQMSVTDPAAYASAWADFAAANADQGVSYLSALIADGNNPATHVAVNWANSPGELLMNQPQSFSGWESFSQRVSGIRTIEATAMMQLIATWAAE